MKYFHKSKAIIICTVFLFILSSFFYANNASAQKKEVIQMAILLDTSNSMDGLIDQAKTQLWKIVNELAISKKNGQSPSLEVALYEYGKSSIPSEEGHLRMIVPLSSDLDSVSEKLFALTTNGGDEYCGQVIDSAIKGLNWNKGKDIYKVIFIAGNEPFTQGNVDYVKSCKNAVSKGIIVNTIFCGTAQEGIDTKWKYGADLADGRYMNIDQNQEIVYIEAPQDEEIARLGTELNNTYIAYGSAGMAKKERQSKQDENAASMSAESAVQRSVAKASAQYNNSAWDIVDAYKEGAVDIENIDDASLPDEMKGMNKSERKAYVEKMEKKRASIQEKINRLNIERRKYVEKEMKNRSKDNTLDEVMIKAIREQAAKKNYRFE